jgi:hypothetical protein
MPKYNIRQFSNLQEKYSLLRDRVKKNIFLHQHGNIRGHQTWSTHFQLIIIIVSELLRRTLPFIYRY